MESVKNCKKEKKEKGKKQQRDIFSYLRARGIFIGRCHAEKNTGRFIKREISDINYKHTPLAPVPLFPNLWKRHIQTCYVGLSSQKHRFHPDIADEPSDRHILSISIPSPLSLPPVLLTSTGQSFNGMQAVGVGVKCKSYRVVSRGNGGRESGDHRYAGAEVTFDICVGRTATAVQLSSPLRWLLSWREDTGRSAINTHSI